MNKKSTQGELSEFIVNVFSGTGLGLLVGVIVGLSLTPVVSVIIGALASLLAGFLGLQSSDGGSSDSGPGTDTSTLSRLRLNGVRIGCFGFATVFGLLLALYIRSAEPFAPNLDEAVQRWRQIGFEPTEAADIVLYDRLGIVPRNREVNAEIAVQQQKQKSHALFAELEDIQLCFELDPARMRDNPTQLIKAYRRQDNAALDKLADQVEAMPEDAQLPALQALHTLMCELQDNGA